MMKVLKTFSKVSQILTILAAAAAIVFFFFGFASVTADGVKHILTGGEMVFKGGEVVGGETVKLARSADVAFCFLLTVLGVFCSALTFAKGKTMRFLSPFFTLASGIYMLVIALSRPVYFVDVRPLVNVDYSTLTYEFGVWAITISLLAAAVLGIVYLLLDDKIITLETKEKYTLPQKVVRFFKDYKSESKKIVWPTFKTVCRNTLIVFAICAIFGVFIWAVDFGLAELLKVLFGQ